MFNDKGYIVGPDSDLDLFFSRLTAVIWSTNKTKTTKPWYSGKQSGWIHNTSYLKRGETLFKMAPSLHFIFGLSVLCSSLSLNING